MQLGLDARGRVCGELLDLQKSVIRHTHPQVLVVTKRNVIQTSMDARAAI